MCESKGRYAGHLTAFEEQDMTNLRAGLTAIEEWRAWVLPAKWGTPNDVHKEYREKKRAEAAERAAEAEYHRPPNGGSVWCKCHCVDWRHEGNWKHWGACRDCDCQEFDNEGRTDDQ